MAFNNVSKIDDRVAIRTVLVSVFDKTGLAPFVAGLREACPGVKFLSTGGTYKALEEALGPAAGECLSQVSSYTGQPEMQGGLVKTLDFKIYLGLLGEHYNDAHLADLARTGASEIDMVVCNLYPFEKVSAKPGVSPEECRSNIDIGGPCMCRASAKNYIRVASVTDPSEYPAIVDELKANGGRISLATRFRLMQKAFAHTAAYDKAIAAHFGALTASDVASVYEC